MPFFGTSQNGTTIPKMKTTSRMVERIEALWVQAYNTQLKEMSFRELKDILKLRKETEEAVTDIHLFLEKRQSTTR